MADFSKFKIGSTSYNVKDVNAGRTLDISGTDLSLKNAAGNTISTVTLPSGGGDTGFYPLVNITNTSWNNPSGYFNPLLNFSDVPFTDNLGLNIYDPNTNGYLGVRADAVIFNGQWQNVETYLETLPNLGDTVTIDMFKWHSTNNQWFWIRVNATYGGDKFGLTNVGQHGFNSTMDPSVLPQ